MTGPFLSQRQRHARIKARSAQRAAANRTDREMRKAIAKMNRRMAAKTETKDVRTGRDT